MAKKYRQILSLILCALLVSGTAPIVMAEDAIPDGFTGVYSIEDLYAIRYALDRNYILMADIDLTDATAEGGDWDNGHGWAPIGDNQDLPFSGVFDGNGHTITGMQIRNGTDYYVGLFGYVKEGDIRNLTLLDAVIEKTGKSGAYCGALAGYVSGKKGISDIHTKMATIENITVTGLSMTEVGSSVGGISGGAAAAYFRGCKTDGTIHVLSTATTAYAGGIVGYGSEDQTVNISRCANKANITVDETHKASTSGVEAYAYVGGIAGRATGIGTSYNTGDISATAWACRTNTSSGSTKAIVHVGGICGLSYSVTNCYNTGSVQATAAGNTYSSSNNHKAYIGGISGNKYTYNTPHQIKSCLNLGQLPNNTDNYYISAMGGGTLQNCYYLRGTAQQGCCDLTDTATTAVALSQAQIKIKSAMGNLDFDTTWYIDLSSGVEHPQLRSNSEVPHEHTYEGVTTPPTCTEKGFTTYTCPVCGDSYTDDETDALGHDFGAWTVITAPTCTEGGEETRHCSRCEATETQSVAAAGHRYLADVTEPTCTEKGFTTYTCSACGDSYTDDETDARGHDFGAWTVTTAPTCTEEGEETRYCSRCEATETQPVDVIAHPYTAFVTEPTCTQQGYVTYVCPVCSDYYVADYKDALGHAWEKWAVTTEPTCTDAGVQTHVCSRCNFKENQPLAAIGHQYLPTITAPTCTQQGFTTYQCSRCSARFTANYANALGHAWDDGEITTEPTCTEAGVKTFTCQNDSSHTRTEPVPAKGHSYKSVITAPTCTEKGFTTYTCSVCNDSYITDESPALGHSCETWTQTKAPTVYAEGEKTGTCSRCGNTMTQSIQKLPMPKVIIQNFTTSSKTYDYRSTIMFKVIRVENELPNGQIHWFVDGKDVRTGDTYTAENVKQSFALQAKYFVDGKEIPEAATEVEKVNVNTGFFAKLKAFFRGLFGLLPKVTQAYLGIEIVDQIL